MAVFVMIPTNTIATGDKPGGETTPTLDYITTQMDAMLTKIRQAGKWAVLMTAYPRPGLGAEKVLRLNQANDWARAQAGREGVKVLDCDPVLAPGGVQDVALFVQEVGQYIHLNNRGAILLAQQLAAPLLATMVAQMPAAGLETHPTDHLTGNLFPADVANLVGATGGKPGGSGSVADGCSTNRV